MKIFSHLIFLKIAKTYLDYLYRTNSTKQSQMCMVKNEAVVEWYPSFSHYRIIQCYSSSFFFARFKFIRFSVWRVSIIFNVYLRFEIRQWQNNVEMHKYKKSPYYSFQINLIILLSNQNGIFLFFFVLVQILYLVKLFISNEYNVQTVLI